MSNVDRLETATQFHEMCVSEWKVVVAQRDQQVAALTTENERLKTILTAAGISLTWDTIRKVEAEQDRLQEALREANDEIIARGLTIEELRERVKTLEEAARKALCILDHIGSAVPVKSTACHCDHSIGWVCEEHEAQDRAREIRRALAPQPPAEPKRNRCSLCDGTGIMPGEHDVTEFYEAQPSAEPEKEQ